ncbi:MAG: hypothetical protein K2K57_08655 [Oscillospiraceae bacterium]|nr:hypothetical protein [Oscillospiraceae bacterium]
MGISPISTGSGGFESYSQNGGGIGAVPNKISNLQKQKEDYEKAMEKTSDPNVTGTLQGKIEGLERRIDTLKKRLEKLEEEENNGECQTCKNRKYQDGSDDPGVSFKSATKISPEAAASAVRGHEMEHVYRNRAAAAREGKEIVSQSVVIKSAICPECGKAYVSGGETKTVTRTKPEDKFNVGTRENDPTAVGGMFDKVA